MRRNFRRTILAASLTALGACTQLSAEDKAALAAANANAEQAKTLAQQALDSARANQADIRMAAQAASQAAQAATQAAQAADRAAKAAQDSSEKVERLFNRSQHKIGQVQ